MNKARVTHLNIKYEFGLGEFCVGLKSITSQYVTNVTS